MSFPTRNGIDGKINPDDYLQNGMTLRDWFAGQALIGILNSDCADTVSLVRHAYDIANTMMEERKK